MTEPVFGRSKIMATFLELLLAVILALAVTDGKIGGFQIGRIVGGRDANPGEFPYQVALRLEDPNLLVNVPLCGGAIVDKFHFLTAGQCVADYSEEISVYAGVWNVSDTTEPSRVELTIAKVFTHDDFNFMDHKNDIALVRVETEIPLDNTAISAIPLHNGSLASTTICTVTGWGKTKKVVKSDILQALEEPLISQEICEQCYENFTTHIEPGMMCAGYLDGGHDPCQGDAGGPLVCEGQLAGLVSWVNWCALPNFPGVFTDVHYYRDWIQSTLTTSYKEASQH